MPPKTFETNQLFIYKVYKPLLIVMLLLFGYNVGLSKSGLKRIFFGIYAGILIGIFSYCTMTCCPSQELTILWQLLEYDAFVIITLLNKSQILTIVKKLSSLDIYLRVNRRHYLKARRRMCVIIFTIWLIGLGHAVSYCILCSCSLSIGRFIFYELSLLALDVNRVWRYYLLEGVWRKMKLLRVRMEELPEAGFYLYVKDNKSMKENKMKLCLQLFKSIADLMDVAFSEINASFFVSIICSLPLLIVNAYRLLLVIDNSYPANAAGFMIVHILQTSLFIFSPCVVIELYRSEIEKIRLYLIHRLILVKDPGAKEDIQLFLQYTKIRSPRFRSWRMVPMDLSLPLNILSLCTTYVIVIVNFTKVFD